jgi:hypothetical protein
VNQPRAAARHVPSSFEEGEPQQRLGYLGSCCPLGGNFEVSLNCPQDLVKRFKYLSVFKAKDANAVLFQKPHAFHIVIRPCKIKVTLSVQLHSQSTRGTVEVDNIGPNTVLASEFRGVELGTL